MSLPASRRSSRTARPARLAAAADKHQAILDAAIRVFARRGFFNAQVADVARAAGVAAGTVYLYFHGKDDLLMSIFSETMRQARAEAAAALDGVSDPVERLRRLAHLHLDRLGRNRDLAVVFQVELRQSIKFMEKFSAADLQEYFALIRDAFACGQACGIFRTDLRPSVAAKLFFGALDEMATNWILSRRRYPLAPEADVVVDLFVNGARVRDDRGEEAGVRLATAGECANSSNPDPIGREAS